MPFLIIFICLIVFLSGHATRQEKLEKEAEDLLHAVVRLDWYNDIPLDALFSAKKACTKLPNLKWCDQVDNQIVDLSESYYSCVNDNRSTLCQAFVLTIQNHGITSVLPKASPFPLPHSPFYWSLPFRALEALSNKYGYREEVSAWWWSKWRASFISGFYISFLYALFLIVRSLWARHVEELDSRDRKLEAERSAAEAKKASQEAFLRKELEKKRLKDLEEEKRIAEQVRQEQLLTEKRAMEQEKVSKLAAERAEARKTLEAAFSSTPINRSKGNGK
jgi:hypothetical protein